MYRCLASETECDKLRERANELRRKLEDTQAALLELGRENQSLQVIIAARQLCNTGDHPVFLAYSCSREST